MESYLNTGGSDHYDLVTPDGFITEYNRLTPLTAQAVVTFENISTAFVGFDIDHSLLQFNVRSVLAQVGVDAEAQYIELDFASARAVAHIELRAYGPYAQRMLELLGVGSNVGKLFAADDRRCVRNPDYLSRMFGRADRDGRPLLSLGGFNGTSHLVLEKIDGRTVAFLALKAGVVKYDSHFMGCLPTFGKALKAGVSTRQLLSLHQKFIEGAPRVGTSDDILLLKTAPLHVRTVFARVVDNLLPKGYRHTSANILQPDTLASGDIYEFVGAGNNEISDVPLEFYTLEPHREYVFFEDRDQLQGCLEDQKRLFDVFDKAPQPGQDAAVFVVKGQQLMNLQAKDWIVRPALKDQCSSPMYGPRHAVMVDRYIESQALFPFLEAMTKGSITSQGVLFTRFFPSPLTKRLFLTDDVRRCVKGLYFEKASSEHDCYFSQEDRAFLSDLVSFAIPVFWVDRDTRQVLQYVHKPETATGLFVPVGKVHAYLKSTSFGVYGSNLKSGNFESELSKLLSGVLALRSEFNHPLLGPATPLSLITGGGPGAMEVGNRVARSLGILSCGFFVDFRTKPDSVVNEQATNPYVEAKMTYHLDRLVHRQAEFNLDFPIFLTGGIGTDFEFCLEEVRRKVGAVQPTPIILFGEPDYWREKITTRFQCNRASGTIVGSEWISNCFYCVQTAEQGLHIYRQYFSGTLPIGSQGPVYEDGFKVVEPICAKNMSI